MQNTGEIRIIDWKPYSKNTLVGFVSFELQSGLIINHCAVHERGEAKWLSPPAREWLDSANKRQFSNLIDFRDRSTRERFQSAVLGALDRFLSQQQESVEEKLL